MDSDSGNDSLFRVPRRSPHNQASSNIAQRSVVDPVDVDFKSRSEKSKTRVDNVAEDEIRNEDRDRENESQAEGDYGDNWM
jgi:hypothetical protein